ncbi:MAG: hypothetical protein LBJ32_00865, partial [Oscillospiraceae bacterium]|nr:hypothetical protein [Oscillospiraceae bacterium]
KAEKEINQVSLKTGEKNKTSFLKVLATGLAIFLAIPMTQNLYAVNPETGKTPKITDNSANLVESAKTTNNSMKITHDSKHKIKNSIIKKDLTVPSLFLVIAFLGLGDIYQYFIKKNETDISQTDFHIWNFDDFKTINKKLESTIRLVDINSIPKALKGPNPGLCQTKELENFKQLNNNQIYFLKRILEVIFILYANLSKVFLILKNYDQGVNILCANLLKVVEITKQLNNKLGTLPGIEDWEKNDSKAFNWMEKNIDVGVLTFFDKEKKCEILNIYIYLENLQKKAKFAFSKGINLKSAKDFFLFKSV